MARLLLARFSQSRGDPSGEISGGIYQFPLSEHRSDDESLRLTVSLHIILSNNDDVGGKPDPYQIPVNLLGSPPAMDAGRDNNQGVPPDIEVELDPLSVRQGHDPQLEKAVEVVMAELEKNPVPRPKRPPYPKYQR